VLPPRVEPGCARRTVERPVAIAGDRELIEQQLNGDRADRPRVGHARAQAHERLGPALDQIPEARLAPLRAHEIGPGEVLVATSSRWARGHVLCQLEL